MHVISASNIFVGFSSEETPESSYKGENRIHVFYVKRVFSSTRLFESTSENTYCCERVHVL